MTDFGFNDHYLDDLHDSVVEKFEDLLNLKEITIENEEIPQFAKIGKVIGNNELIDIYRNLINEYEQNMNDENVISLI